METAQRVALAINVGLGFGALLVVYFFLSHRSEDGGATRCQRWFVMWSERQSVRHSADMKSVYIPVSSMPYQSNGMESGEPPAPDIDAENTDMPRLSRNITDNEMIVLLAAQRGKDGKHRYSANQIQALVGGDRNAVLARVKEIRATPPSAEYMQPDGTRVPPSHPVTRRQVA